MRKRLAAVAGGFYPNDKAEIEDLLNQFNRLLLQNGTVAAARPRAVIVPHAGYIYSGFTANSVYANCGDDYKKVVVLGPSHRVYFKGCSVANYDMYETPLGDLQIQTSLTRELIERFACCNFYPDAHKEHSTETQMPFIKHYFPNASIVEIVYCDVGSDELEAIMEFISDEETLIVISSDLSHFYDLNRAKMLDKHCLDAIATLDADIANTPCEACGMLGIEAVITYARKKNLNAEICDYRTSFEMTNDDSSVVGYCGAMFTRKQ
jgi:hypothetical protein